MKEEVDKSLNSAIEVSADGEHRLGGIMNSRPRNVGCIGLLRGFVKCQIILPERLPRVALARLNGSNGNRWIRHRLTQ